MFLNKKMCGCLIDRHQPTTKNGSKTTLLQLVFFIQSIGRMKLISRFAVLVAAVQEVEQFVSLSQNETTKKTSKSIQQAVKNMIKNRSRGVFSNLRNFP